MDRETVQLELTGYEEEDVLDLKDWLENADVAGLSVTETSEQREGTMGPEWVPILTALLSGPAVIVLANAVRDWVKYRKKKLKAVIVKADGTSITIESENM